MNDKDELESLPISLLNQAAHSALMGFSADWRTPLVLLLRSEEPLSWAVRNALANAIECEDPSGILMKLGGHDRIQKRIDGLKARRKWLLHGRVVAGFVQEDKNVTIAFERSAEKLGKDDTYCRKKYYYYVHCKNWIEMFRGSGFWYSKMQADELEDVWHFASMDQKSDKPIPPSGAEFDKVRFARIEHIKQVFAGSPSMQMAVDTLVAYCEFFPPEDG